MAPRSRPQIALVGSGQIGAVLAMLAAQRQLGDVRMFDIAEGIPQGKALDLSHLSACDSVDATLTGMNDAAAALKGADVVIITAGVPRKPGMSRDDLLGINGKIITDIAGKLRANCPDAFVICITNPLDAMVHLLQEKSGLPAARVVGMSGVLDSSRFRHLLAQKCGVSVESVQATVIGGHGDSMVPLRRFSTVAGLSLADAVRQKWLTEAELAEIENKTRNGGGEIVALLKTGSAFFAPAASAIKMAEAYLKDRKLVVPAAVRASGEYGVNDLYVGVPAVIGASGVEKIIEYPLDDAEKSAFKTSVDNVKDLIEALKKLAIL